MHYLNMDAVLKYCSYLLAILSYKPKPEKAVKYGELAAQNLADVLN